MVSAVFDLTATARGLIWASLAHVYEFALNHRTDQTDVTPGGA